MSDTFTIDTGVGIATDEIIDPLSVYDENHPMLRQKIPEYPYALPSPVMTKLAKRLKMTMKLFGGIGLSANQCGVFERIFVIGTDQFQIACINPKIINVSSTINRSAEGCLSFPGLYLTINRPEWIEVEFTNEEGVVQQMRLEGLTARCFQHELDHLNGIRFVDDIKPVALQMARKKQKKLMQKIVKEKMKRPVAKHLNIPKYKDDLSQVISYIENIPLSLVKTKYNDGNWEAISLRGYSTDPENILKPGVLKTGASEDTLQDTTLRNIPEMSAINEILKQIPAEFERVRIMRLKAGTKIEKTYRQGRQVNWL
jgi:peptide deformylase